MPTTVEVAMDQRSQNLVITNLRQWLTTALPLGRGLTEEQATAALEGTVVSCTAARDQHLLVVRALLRDDVTGQPLLMEAELHSKVDYRVVKGDPAEEATRFTWPWHVVTVAAR